jgi:hypothetical protein
VNQSPTDDIVVPQDLRQASLARLIEATAVVVNEISQRFGPLTTEQLNWKPSADEWSIGQCLDHLIVTDSQYCPIFEQVVQGNRTTKFLERMPLLPKLSGDMLFRASHPDTARPIKNPAIFAPTSSSVDPEIVPKFRAHQEQLVGLMEASSTLPVEQIIISSPVSKLIVLRMADAYRIIVAHQFLHLLQADRLRHLADFPA